MKHIAILTIAAVAAALAIPAAAQTAAPTKTLTRDEYRACMDNQDALKTRADAIKERTAKLREEGDAIKVEDEQLQAEQKRVEDSSVMGARDRFDRKVKAHNARARAAEETSKGIQAEATKWTADLDAHNAKCSNVSVNREDREAVDKDRAAAGKK
jgi:hypothetical protein